MNRMPSPGFRGSVLLLMLYAAVLSALPWRLPKAQLLALFAENGPVENLSVIDRRKAFLPGPCLNRGFHGWRGYLHSSVCYYPRKSRLKNKILLENATAGVRHLSGNQFEGGAA